MEKVYLVTSKEQTTEWGDSLQVDGVFSTKEGAYKYGEWALDNNVIENDWKVTEMTLDNPQSNKEYEGYPSVYM